MRVLAKEGHAHLPMGTHWRFPLGARLLEWNICMMLDVSTYLLQCLIMWLWSGTRLASLPTLFYSL